MSYDIGTYIDLTHMNYRNEVAPRNQKKSDFQEAVSNAYEVGTQIIFNFKAGQAQATRRIPILYA